MCGNEIVKTGFLEIIAPAIILNIPFTEDKTGRVSFHKGGEHGVEKLLKYLAILVIKQEIRTFFTRWNYDEEAQP